MRNLMLVLWEAIYPEILAEAHLRDKLSILMEVIVKVLWLKVFIWAFKISDIKPNMEVSFELIVLGYLGPV